MSRVSFDHTNRRRQPRLCRELEAVYCEGSEQFETRALNISRSGACLATSRPLTPGTEVALRFDLGTEGEITAAGECVWTDAGTAGVRFTRIAFLDDILLSHWLFKKLAS